MVVLKDRVDDLVAQVPIGPLAGGTGPEPLGRAPVAFHAAAFAVFGKGNPATQALSTPRRQLFAAKGAFVRVPDVAALLD